MSPEIKDSLFEMLTADLAGGAAASVSVIAQEGTEPQTFWVPESEEEPAFLAYSITKTLTSTLVLKLCEEGRLSLDDRLARWFPRIDRAERIPLRQLLNHTAGISDYGGIRAYHDSVRSSSSIPWSFERFASETFEKGLCFEPGQGWAYSNPGYMLVKRIAEEVTGMTYRALVSNRIAQPFGLSRTFVPESIDDLQSLAPGTSSVLAPDGSPRDVRTHYHPGWVSHGVVASTTSDIVRFFDRLFHGQFLSEHSLDQMRQLVIVPVASSGTSSMKDCPSRWGRPSYGLGLMGDPVSPWGLLLGHNGRGPGYIASAFHAVDLRGASVCVMGAMEENFNAENVVFGIFDRLAASCNTCAAQPAAGADR
jgi:D-alanyl-D-alanine carboxypeptidase